MPLYDPPAESVVNDCIKKYEDQQHVLSLFGKSVHEFFSTHPALTTGDLPAVHTSKFRLKDPGRLREKIIRKKVEDNRDITADVLFQEVNDLAGVRILHLHKEQFTAIHSAIVRHISDGHWVLFEKPIAYTWDPEHEGFFAKFDLRIEVKESSYTSVHYVVKPSETSPLSCEIQVRTLFEEVWGEIDHVLNYPTKIDSVACSEQLRVLAKMVGAGSRLAEAIFRTYGEHVKSTQGTAKAS